MLLSEVSSSSAMLRLYFIVILTLHLLAQGEGQLCPPHQTYTKCGTACPQNCSNLHSGPHPCTLQCVPGCFCNPGYVFNNDVERICIPECDCPEHECPPTQIFNQCASACPLTCDNYENPPPCPRICVPRCTCPEGLVLDTETHRCVLPRHCPCSEECPPHQTYTDCGTACPRTCHNWHSEPRPCTLQCVSGCFCNPGYVFNNEIERICIPEHECPEPVCPPTQIFNPCASACPLTCDNYDHPLPCPRICVPRCTCPRGLVLDEETQRCVLPRHCPWPHECPPHQTYTDCGTACPRNCSNVHSEPLLCTRQCVPGCFCDAGYVFDNNFERRCIPEYQCPRQERCPSTQIFSECATCPLTCSNYENPGPCPAICIPGCICSPGYVIDEETQLCVSPEDCPF